MFFGAGEILHGCAVAGGLEEPYVHLYGQGQLHADLVLSLGYDFHDLWILQQVFDLRFGPPAGDQHVQISDGLFAPPQAARRGDPQLPRCRSQPQVGAKFLGRLLGHLYQEASGAEPVGLDGLQDFPFQFFAHPRQLADVPFAAKLFDLVQGRGPVGAPNQRNALRPQPLNAQHLQYPRRKFLQQDPMAGESAGGTDCPKVCHHALSNARNGQQLPISRFGVRLTDDLTDAFRPDLDRLRRVAVAAHAEAILAGDFHQVGGFRKQLWRSPCFPSSASQIIGLIAGPAAFPRRLSSGCIRGSITC